MTQSEGKVRLIRVEGSFGISLLPLAQKYHNEIYPDWDYDEELTVEQINSLVGNENVYMWAIIIGNRLAGVIAFARTTPIGGGPLTAAELFWYILPEYRNSLPRN